MIVFINGSNEVHNNIVASNGIQIEVDKKSRILLDRVPTWHFLVHDLYFYLYGVDNDTTLLESQSQNFMDARTIKKILKYWVFEMNLERVAISWMSETILKN